MLVARGGEGKKRRGRRKRRKGGGREGSLKIISNNDNEAKHVMLFKQMIITMITRAHIPRALHALRDLVVRQYTCR